METGTKNGSRRYGAIAEKELGGWKKSHYFNRLETADIKAVTDDGLIFAYYILRYTKEISWRSLFSISKPKTFFFSP